MEVHHWGPGALGSTGKAPVGGMRHKSPRICMVILRKLCHTDVISKKAKQYLSTYRLYTVMGGAGAVRSEPSEPLALQKVELSFGLDDR